MTMKSGKGKKPGDNHTPSSVNEEKKASPKSKKQEEVDDDVDGELVDGEDMEVKSSKKGKPAAAKKGTDEDDDDDDAADEPDDWEKPEEEEEWDPDFDEFDIPASKTKKASGPAGKKGKEEEEEFKVDDEFKEMGLYNDSYEDDEDDDY